MSKKQPPRDRDAEFDDGMITIHAPDQDDEPFKTSEPAGGNESLKLFFIVVLVVSLLVIAYLITNQLGLTVNNGI